ncbi:SH3 domain-containing protein [Microbispora amethystogenes]|uniref:SH3 domain-containing protein n=1 Tax=Microbispora amethystogenes TaxID=1427754 RepID=UPI0019538252|nr:SH3 domain-containing protein [Microbispora amethystogenes]
MRVARSVVPALAVWASAGWLSLPAYGFAATRPPAPGGPAAAVRPPVPGGPAAAVPHREAGRPPGRPGASGSRREGIRQEVTRQIEQAPGRVCAYRLQGVSAGGFLHVRAGAGHRHAPVGRLRVSDGGFAGSCAANHGWIAVRAADGASGFASARYLHRLDLSGRPSLSCAYRLRHVHKGGYLNVREGAGLGHVPVGKIRPAQGNIAGACTAGHGWVAVDTADGIPGWASARYLRKIP